VLFAWLIMASIILILFILSQSGLTHSSGTIVEPQANPGSVGLTGTGSNVAGSLTSFFETMLNIHRKLPLLPPKEQISITFCNSNLDYNKARPFKPGKPILYIVTPTYSRREQIIELTRLSHTLLHVDNVVWIVAEDSLKCTDLVETLLNRFGMPYVQLASPMPSMYLKEKYKPRGVASRRAGKSKLI
jgi:hypothetical protein